MTESVFRQIAHLHAAQLRAGLLSSFGEPFLALFYRHAATAGILVTEERGGKVIGFALATQSAPEFYRAVLPKLYLRIAVALLLRPDRAFRALSISRHIHSTTGAELLSIAVEPAAQRSGVGSKLMTKLHDAFARRGVGEYRVSASETQTSALDFYANHGGEIVSEFDLGGLRTFDFLMKCPETATPVEEIEIPRLGAMMI